MYSIVVKKFRPHSSKSIVEGKENIINRDFKASNINEKWYTDITYISIQLKTDGLILLLLWISIAKRLHIVLHEINDQGGRKCLLNVEDIKGIILYSKLRHSIQA